MNEYKIQCIDGTYTLETKLLGKALLTIPQLNKGTAFTMKERLDFKLIGKLPLKVETLGEQVNRCYLQFKGYKQPYKKNIFLNNLLNCNQVLFYALVVDNLVEMLPYIYTPAVGSAVKEFSHEFRMPRGLYLAYPDMNFMDSMLDNRTNADIDVIVVTDGEGVLGIGDQGIGGADIPVAKLMVYTACGGVDPNRTLPIFLDVGTNNRELLEDPMYIGWRRERLKGDLYDEFIEKFINSVKKRFPGVLLHWEDFGREKAYENLQKYKDNILSFNDDIQGTGVITAAAVFSVVNITRTPLNKQRIVIFGAGAAGTGIAEQICKAMIQSGISEKEARALFYLIDKNGLLVSGQAGLNSMQARYARSKTEMKKWVHDKNGEYDLLETISKVKPTILIGTSGVSGAFNKKVITEMAKHVDMPAVMPLSNPTYCAEVIPEDLVSWTNGNVLIATGSPFPNVIYKDRNYEISQCNNALAFPGIGIGSMLTKSRVITDNMLYAASIAISEYMSRTGGSNVSLLPTIADSVKLAKVVAHAVAEASILDKVNTNKIDIDSIEKNIESNFWTPHYLQYDLG
ncbi:MAG: NAD-dependent malic enzyme [Legionellales bacterium]|jgi:malate dehydrogenase (oxaloacetate-decarboxylating)|nr:NAD-dependent malic enzyme [Legionellales bacterium]